MYLEFITGSNQRNDVAALVAQFLAEGFDMCVYRPCCSGEVISPYPVQQLFPAENLFRIFHKKMKQFIFLVGQGDFLPVQKDLM